MPDKEPIGVIGVGWVGLVTAACFAELGHEVWARDILPEKVASLVRGEVPIHEPGLSELVTKNADRLHFTTDMAETVEHAQLLFCCVDTPPTYSGDADLSRVEAVIAELRESEDHALVMKSTVPVGTGRSITRRRDGLGYVSAPEFLKEGSAVDDFMQPDRVVIGANSGSEAFADRVEALYAPLGGVIVRTDVASAEMVKLASNAFLATKISFINEIANVSEELGADVREVAKGMGLDDRIGPKFLQAGIGYGGSCLAGEETVLARHHGRTTLLSFDQLWKRLEEEDEPEDGVIQPGALEVLTWVLGSEEPLFLPVMCVTRRDYDGDLVDVRTKMGRRLSCTPDHPMIVSDGQGGDAHRKFASQLSDQDWVPVALGRGDPADPSASGALVSAADVAELSPREVIVRPKPERIRELLARSRAERDVVLGGASTAGRRAGQVKSSGALRLDELALAEIPLEGSTLRTRFSRQQVSSEIALDRAFWRVVGLYLAEGHATRSGEARLAWFFHPTKEQHLVDDVVAYWMRQGVASNVFSTPTAKAVAVRSRLLWLWWTQVLGLGHTSYEQRLPDLIWDRPAGDKWALLSGLWEGDGSWSLVNGGPSVILECGTVSDELADGVLRLLADLGIVASRRIGRAPKSTKDTHWIRVSSADQVEAAIELVPHRDRPGVLASIARQKKRIRSTGYRRFADGPAWTRVVSTKSRSFKGPVFSLEVPGAHTFVTSGGLVCSNCFPKDVQALKQLAGNTGYHFQLLTAVIEVNELQKRRTIGKLQKHLGSLVGKEIALLGVAFKPNTDDIREATSLVLAGRLQGEGAQVRVYDPVATDRAQEQLAGAHVAASALDALDGADAVVLVTEWPEFRELDWAGEVKSRLRTPIVVDGRNFLDREALLDAGYTYEGVGR
ncbi:MAG TPA: nucleotide sugar dehydrogenase [Thermoleophilaceae bacterium]|nr:nucleotide sugar dehydrogenase [Thermoleophilaceae bacterium]